LGRLTLDGTTQARPAGAGPGRYKCDGRYGARPLLSSR